MLKRAGRTFAQALGYELNRLQQPASHLRPIGRLVSVLEDVRARGFTPSLVFDAGASDGSWTREMRTVFPDPQVILIEPRPAKRAALDELCARDGKCRPVTAAVGAATGVGTLTDWDTGSTLLPVTSTSPQSPVQVITLDDLSVQWGVPDLAKIDVEGFEIEALKGASRLLGSTELFIVEVALFEFDQHPMLHDVVAFMAGHGYFVYDVAGYIRRPFDGAVGLIDLCFARASGLLRRNTHAW